MSKLFQLKNWLTIEDAARHLSGVFSEPVSEADILRLALDRRLTLSVQFVNGTSAKRGKIVSIEDAKSEVLEKARAKGMADLPSWFADAAVAGRRRLDDNRIFELEPDVIGLSGVYDLPMIGSEELDIEHKYQRLTGGPAVTLEDHEGAFVQEDDVTLYQLQEGFDDDECVTRDFAELAHVENRLKAENLNPEEAERLRLQHTQLRKKFLDRSGRVPGYYPAGGLPPDAVLVVRTGALRELLNQIASPRPRSEASLGPRAATTYQNIIGALLQLILGRSGGRKHSIFLDQTAVIDHLVETHKGRAGLSQRTLQEKFAEAKRSLEAD